MTAAQLHEAGLDNDAIAWRVKNARLFRVHRGVYAVGRPPATPLEQAAAAVLACGERAALSHGSAMVLWGMWKRWEEPFDVSIAGDRRPPGITVHRVSGLLRRDVRIRHGIPVTTAARALLDCAPGMAPKSLTRRINDARRAGILTVEAIADVVERFPFHAGAPLLAPHARTTQNPTRSGLEDEFLPFCKRFGLPQPRVNIELHGYEVDAFFPFEMVIVELDGEPFHTDPQSFEADRERDATMLERGIPTVRITRRRLRARPEREAARLESILASRRGRRAS